MSASIVFSGPPLSPQRALVLMKEIAPLVIGRPLSLARVEGGTLSDGNGAAACWFEKWADGDVTLSAVVDNDSGNPRDGYGYIITLKLMSSYLDKPQWWRAEINGGAWEPMLSSPFRVGLLGVAPSDYEVIRARLVALLPEHHEQSFADSYAILATLEDFVHHGHSDWVKAYYAGKTSLPAPGLSAYLCAHKMGLMGPDPITAGVWIELEPSNPRAWSALAAAGGSDAYDADQARFVATLLDPWPEASKLPTTGAFVRERRALHESLAHHLRDERWRPLGDAEASPPQPTTAPAEQVIWTGPFHPSNVSVIEERMATVAGFPAPPGRASGASRWSQKLSAPPGNLPTWVHTSPGVCVRGALFERADPIIQSKAFLTCETNCENRLSSFGLLWLGPTRHVAWRSSMSLEGGAPTRSPVLIDVIDRGDGSWGDAVAKVLREVPAKGFVSATS